MDFSQFNKLPIRQILVIIVILNYTGKVDSSDLIEEIISALNPFEHLVSFPKHHVFTDEEIAKYNEEYSEGLKHEDVYLNGTQLIQKYGYNVEEHHVITSDGYDLGLYRIPGKGRVVFLMHGVLSSFVDWLTAGPDQGLAYLLAAQGYDVWMGNARGNTFSRKHIRLSPSDPEFWNFSFNEIGSIDLASMIDYVLENTRMKKISYIGHSQGTTSFFVLCSTKPEYNNKIDFMVALSAVAWMKHVPNPMVQIVAPNNKLLYAMGTGLGLNEVAPDDNLKKALTLTLCGDSFLASTICDNVMFLMCGFDPSQVNYKQAPVIFNHAPAGSSLMQFEHYAQLVESGYFRHYDHGVALNFKKYGSAAPPSYPVDKITVPVAIFYSQGDWLASPIDVNNLRRRLRNVVDYYEIPLASFNHGDFLWAKDVKTLVYDRILSLMEKY